VSLDPRRVCALLYDGLCTFEFSIAAEIFGLPRPEFGEDWYRFATASETGDAVSATGGITVKPIGDLTAMKEAGTIILPGWRTENEAPSEALQDMLLGAHRRGARIISICSGAFLLAAIGLLDGKGATTHWLYAEKLAARYPSLHVKPDVLFVDEGSVMTSAGSAAGIDLLLHVVRSDYGAERANAVARRLVMPAHREGDQRQFVAAPVARRTQDRLRPLLDEVRNRPSHPWDIEGLAKDARMSRRTFVRHFREATGQTPMGYITAVRLDAAREALESSNDRIEMIAHRTGFGTAATLQLHFKRAMGCTPSAYRRRFSRQGGQLTPA
jgi:AraC family transcriptional activator FtrA